MELGGEREKIGRKEGEEGETGEGILCNNGQGKRGRKGVRRRVSYVRHEITGGTGMKEADTKRTANKEESRWKGKRRRRKRIERKSKKEESRWKIRERIGRKGKKEEEEEKSSRRSRSRRKRRTRSRSRRKKQEK